MIACLKCKIDDAINTLMNYNATQQTHGRTGRQLFNFLQACGILIIYRARPPQTSEARQPTWYLAR